MMSQDQASNDASFRGKSMPENDDSKSSPNDDIIQMMYQAQAAHDRQNCDDGDKKYEIPALKKLPLLRSLKDEKRNEKEKSKP